MVLHIAIVTCRKVQKQEQFKSLLQSFRDGKNPLCQWKPPLLHTSENGAHTSFWLDLINDSFC